jgi:dimethylaniline monooxygenase (N-oxide forming)
MKLCVIGAGAGGLCAAKNGIEFGYEVTVFEQTSAVGGTWVYTDEVGKDKNGLDVHSSMYQGLYTNLPKEVMGYPSIPFPELEDSYIPAAEVLKYYESYADKFDLKKLIKFEHHVVRVRPLLDETWEVIVQDMKAKKFETFIFEAVLVCNGHYSTPNIPANKGQNEFKGKQIHSHEYRTNEAFRGEKVLVVGSGPSGTDCVIEISKTAASVTWSHHLEKLPVTHFGDNVNQKPDIKEISKAGVLFVDESFSEYTAIVYCTGYKYTFPFLSVDCGISTYGNHARPLFKHCLNINKPTMGIIGLPNFICPNQMMDLQVRFCLTFMTGRKDLPTREEMLKDTEKDEEMRRENGLDIATKRHYLGPKLQCGYYEDLAKTAEIEPIKPVITKMFNKGLCNLLHDSGNFRNEVFKVIDDENFIIIEKKTKT